MLAIWSLVPLPFLNPAWISGSFGFTYCWSLAWRILSYYLASTWDECSCVVVWTFFGTAFLWGWNEKKFHIYVLCHMPPRRRSTITCCEVGSVTRNTKTTHLCDFISFIFILQGIGLRIFFCFFFFLSCDTEGLSFLICLVILNIHSFSVSKQETLKVIISAFCHEKDK